jgi:hypothetical protein
LKAGIDILTAFVESNVSAHQDRKHTAGEKRTIERLGLLITEHLAPCLDVLSKIAQCGDRRAIMTSVGASAHLANVIDWIDQNKPKHVKALSKRQSFFKSLRSWAKHGEVACGSVLKLKPETNVKPATPATRLVLDFMLYALRLRSDLSEATAAFNLYSHVLRQKTLDSYLVDQCGYLAEQLPYKDLPEFSSKHVDVWWEKALKPFLNKPDTLHFVRQAYPIFYRQLETTAANRKNEKVGSSKDSAVKDQLKKRCERALENLASAQV